MEMAVPVWHSRLTRLQTQDIERIQKLAMKIILQDRYLNYQLACNTFSTQTLELRRLKLCSKFSAKNNSVFFLPNLAKVWLLGKKILLESTDATLGDIKKAVCHF